MGSPGGSRAGGGTLLGSVSPASAQTFRNYRPISVADATADGVGRATTYPSRITVTAAQVRATTLQRIQVELEGLVHPRLADLDILLVPPAASGRPAVLLLSDTGGAVDTRGYDDAPERFSGLAISDSINLPAVPAAPVATTVYRATDAGAPGSDLFPDVTLPAAGLTTKLDDLLGMNPIGDWSLYIVDDETGAVGRLDNGWALELIVGVTVESTAGPLTITSPAAPGAVQVSTTTLDVSGLTGPFSSIGLELVGLTHPRPADLELVLRRAGGFHDCHRLQADAGGATPVTNFSYTIEDMWTGYPWQPFNAPLLTGSVRANDTFYADGDDDVDMVGGLPCGYTVVSRRLATTSIPTARGRCSSETIGPEKMARSPRGRCTWALAVKPPARRGSHGMTTPSRCGRFSRRLRCRATSITSRRTCRWRQSAGACI